MRHWLVRFEQNPFFRILVDQLAPAEWRLEVQMMDTQGIWVSHRVSSGQRAYDEALRYGVAA